MFDFKKRIEEEIEKIWQELEDQYESLSNQHKIAVDSLSDRIDELKSVSRKYPSRQFDKYSPADQEKKEKAVEEGYEMAHRNGMTGKETWIKRDRSNGSGDAGR